MRAIVAALASVALVAACSQLEFDRSDWDRDDIGRAFPSGFLLGTATAAHQIEGGNTNSWTRWEQGKYPDGGPHIENNDQSDAASGSWDHFISRDLPLMQQLGANSYRFSVEWSRLEPEPGAWNVDAGDQYLAFAASLRDAGIEPMVTLHHFSLPIWFEDRGGFERRENLAEFEEFVSNVAELLGDQVDLWCTINEPNVFVTSGYVDGYFPPGLQNQTLGAEVMANMIEGHALAAARLREKDTWDADGDGRNTIIGLAHHVRVFQAASGSSFDELVTAISDDFFNQATVEALSTGRIRIEIPTIANVDRKIPGLVGSTDYLGLNYYSRDFVRADLTRASLSVQFVPAERPKNDLNWDIYPEGMLLHLRRWAKYGFPIYILENGIPDFDGDQRPDYVKSHLHAIEVALEEGIDVRGYFHWTLLDNFEWEHGFNAPFGVYRVDFDSPTFTRCPAPGAETFQQVARNMGLQPGPLGCVSVD